MPVDHVNATARRSIFFDQTKPSHEKSCHSLPANPTLKSSKK